MSSTVSFVAAAICLACTLTHYGMTDNQGRTFVFCFRFVQSATDSVGIITVDLDHLPAPSFVFLGSIFDGYVFGFSRKLDVIGIIEHDEVIQSQCTCDTACTLRNFFLYTTVRNISVDGLLHHFFETGFHEFSCDSCTHCESMALTERAGSVFNTTHDVAFRVSRSGAVPLAEFLQFIQCEFTCQCQLRVEHR